MESNHPSVGEIIDSLLDETSTKDVEFRFFLEALSSKITRRQAIILRLIMLGVTSQVDIAKLLGFSFVTISWDIKRIRKIITKLLAEGGVYIKYPEHIKKVVGEEQNDEIED